jgi:hypothetical protein
VETREVARKRFGLRSRTVSGLASAIVLMMGQVPSAKAATPYPQWVTHQDPLGYTVQSPPGWSAWPRREKRRQRARESGSHYHWIDQRGVIVGTETDTRPTIDIRALVRRP